MIVVDTQVIVYWAVRGSASSTVDAVLRRDPRWVAPVLWQSEFRNVLAGMVRRDDLDLEQAYQRYRSASEIVASRVVDSQLVLQLVGESPCTAYDLEFVALARQLGVPLVTNDRQILRAFPDVAISPADFSRPNPEPDPA